MICSLVLVLRNMTALLSTLLILTYISSSLGANILAILPYPSYSHQIAFREIWKELSLRGHQVTLMTTDPMNDPRLTNLTEIDTKFSYAVLRNITDTAENGMDMWIFQEVLRPIFKRVAHGQLLHEKTQDLIHNRNRTFDVVLVEFLFPEFLSFAEIYGCPKILFSSLDANVVIHNAIGNTIHPALYPDLAAPFFPPLSLWERVKSTLYNWYVVYYLLRYTYSDKDETIREFFNIPTTSAELISNVDLLLLNINPVISNIRATGPTTVAIGDISRVRPTPLTKDLQGYLDSAKDGFIYFSLGTNVKSKELKKDSINSIMEALGEMPYKVLWKFEDDSLPGKPDNVKLVKWANQQAILAHPNIKVFVMQGGLQSMEEGIYNEVPFVVIPFYGDQDQNALLLKNKGIAEIVERHPFIQKENLKKAMLEVINNSSYKNTVMRLKQLALDMSMTGTEKAVWWIEYVIRNKGTKHLRNPSADLPLYQYYLIDVIGFLVAVSVVVVYLSLFLLKRTFKLLKLVVGKLLESNKKNQ